MQPQPQPACLVFIICSVARLLYASALWAILVLYKKQGIDKLESIASTVLARVLLPAVQGRENHHLFGVRSCLRKAGERKNHELPSYLHLNQAHEHCSIKLTSVRCTELRREAWVENERHLFLLSEKQQAHFPLVPATAEEVTQQSKLLYGTSNGAEKELLWEDQKCKTQVHYGYKKQNTLHFLPKHFSQSSHPHGTTQH